MSNTSPSPKKKVGTKAKMPSSHTPSSPSHSSSSATTPSTPSSSYPSPSSPPRYSPYPPSLESSLSSPLPPFPLISFDPIQFVSCGFPVTFNYIPPSPSSAPSPPNHNKGVKSSSSSDLNNSFDSSLLTTTSSSITPLSFSDPTLSPYIYQLQRGVIQQLRKQIIFTNDGSDGYQSIRKSIEISCEIIMGILEGVKSFSSMMGVAVDESEMNINNKHQNEEKKGKGSKNAPSSSSSSSFSRRENNMDDKFRSPADPSSSSPSSELSSTLTSLRVHFTHVIRSLRTFHLLLSLIENLRITIDTDPRQYVSIQKIFVTSYEIIPMLSTFHECGWWEGCKGILNICKGKMKQIIYIDCYHHLPELKTTIDLTKLAAAIKIIDLPSFVMDTQNSLSSSQSSSLTNSSPSVSSSASTSLRDKSLFLQWFVDLKLSSYLQSIHNNSYKDILRISDAYTWLYKFLTQYDSIGYLSVFPSHWCVDLLICKKFIEITKMLIESMLNNYTDRTDIYKPLKATVEMELFLTNRAKKPTLPAFPTPSLLSLSPPLFDSFLITHPDSIFSYSRVLSCHFDQYLNVFIELEQVNFETYVSGLHGTEKWRADDKEEGEDGKQNGKSNGNDNDEEDGEERKRSTNGRNDAKDEDIDPKSYYPTVDLLFQKINKSFLRYSKLIRNETLFGIQKEYKRAVVDYIKKMEGHLPGNTHVHSTSGAQGVGMVTTLGTAAASSSSSSLIKKDNHSTLATCTLPSPSIGPLQPLSPDDILLVIRLNNSAVECFSRCKILCADIIKEIDLEYKSHVDFSGVGEAVKSLQNKSVAVLSAHFSSKMDIILSTHLKETKKELALLLQQNAMVEMKSLQSGPNGPAYLVEYAESSIVKHIFNLFRVYIPFFTHLPTLLSTLISTLLPRFVPLFLSHLKRLTRVDEFWAKQLSIDCYVIKSMWMKMESEEYLKIIEKEEGAGGKGGEWEKKMGGKTQMKETKSNANASPVTSPTDDIDAEDEKDLTSVSPSSSLPSSTSPYLTTLLTDFPKLTRFLRVLTSPDAKLVSSFRLIYPKGSPSMLIEIFDLRGLTSGEQQKLVKAYNSGIKVEKQIPIEAFNKGFMSNFMADMKKTIDKI